MSGEAELICLSSDSDNEVEEVKNHQITGMRDDLKQIKSFTSPFKMKSETVYSIPCEGRKLNGSTQEPETVDLSDDSEHLSEGGAPNGNVKEDEILLDEDDDDDAPVIVSTMSCDKTGETSSSSGKDPTPGTTGMVNGNDCNSKDESDEEDDECMTQAEWAERTKKALSNIILELRNRKFKDVTKKNVDKLEGKFEKHFEQLRGLPIKMQKRLLQDIEETKKNISITGRVWNNIRDLLENTINPAKESKVEPEEERKQRKEKELSRLIQKYEQTMLDMQRKIQKLETAECDWNREDDWNSEFLLGEKYKSKMMEAYYTLCDLTKSTRLTGRPIQTKINLKKHEASTGYDEIDTEVEKFLNKGGYLFTPDFSDVYGIVTDTNRKKNFGFTEERILDLSKTLFKSIVLIIRSRREKDLKMTLYSCPKYLLLEGNEGTAKHSKHNGDVSRPDDIEDDVNMCFEDPADQDPELKAKLEENDKLRKSEYEVLDRFVQEQEQRKVEGNEDKDNNDETDSRACSDNEEEEDENEEDVDGSDEEDVDRRRKELTSVMEAELTEDEDEECETFQNSWETVSFFKTCAENTDNGEEKLKTDCDSDTEVNASDALLDSDGGSEETTIVAPEPEQEAAVSDTKSSAGNGSPPSKKPRLADENSNEERIGRPEKDGEKEESTAKMNIDIDPPDAVVVINDTTNTFL